MNKVQIIKLDDNGKLLQLAILGAIGYGIYLYTKKQEGEAPVDTVAPVAPEKPKVDILVLTCS